MLLTHCQSDEVIGYVTYTIPLGTRSVSSLTPAQLTRKRAKDRKAQRAIRVRTKDHIERLERELCELRSRNNRGHTVQELMRRNRALEDELNRLRESMGISATSSPYVKNSTYSVASPPGGHFAPALDLHISALIVYDVSTSSGAIPSPRVSPYPAGSDYVAAAAANGQFAEYSQAGYVHSLPTCETWTATTPAPAQAAAIASNMSSPSPAPAGIPDELAAVSGTAAGHYLPTSATMMSFSSGMGLRGAEEIKMGYVIGNGMSFFNFQPRPRWDRQN